MMPTVGSRDSEVARWWLCFDQRHRTTRGSDTIEIRLRLHRYKLGRVV
jgi:hypothetical protein